MIHSQPFKMLTAIDAPVIIGFFHRAPLFRGEIRTRGRSLPSLAAIVPSTDCITVLLPILTLCLKSTFPILLVVLSEVLARLVSIRFTILRPIFVNLFFVSSLILASVFSPIFLMFVFVATLFFQPLITPSLIILLATGLLTLATFVPVSIWRIRATVEVCERFFFGANPAYLHSGIVAQEVN